jgi:hypothetical protein
MGSMCQCHINDLRRQAPVNQTSIHGLHEDKCGPTQKAKRIKKLYTLEYIQGPTCQPVGGRREPVRSIGVRPNQPWIS